MAARSPPRSSCNASSTARPGRTSTSRGPRCRRRQPTSTPAGAPAMAFACSIAWSRITTKAERAEAMTEVRFSHLQETTLERVLPPLIEKSLERKWRVVVQTSSEERADALDSHLWTYRDDSFLPHGTWRDRDAAEHPVLLSIASDNS